MCITGALLNPSVVPSIVPSIRTSYEAPNRKNGHPDGPLEWLCFGVVFGPVSPTVGERGLILGEFEGLKVRGLRHADYNGDI